MKRVFQIVGFPLRLPFGLLLAFVHLAITLCDCDVQGLKIELRDVLRWTLGTNRYR
jgi:hypothetical protein